MKRKIKIVFLFPTNRQRILETVRDGKSPDNELYGFNYFESLGWQVSFTDVSPAWQNFLDRVFFPLGRLFRRQIDITFQLGRALLMLSVMNKADAILTNTDSIGLPVCFLKRLGLVKPPVVYAVGLFYIQGELKEAVDNGKQTLFRRFYVWILAAADHIIYHSPIEKEKLVKLGLYNPAYCTFVAMGSDAVFFHQAASSKFKVQSSKLIFSVGRDHARDYRTLFEVAEKLPDLKFVVICSRRNIDGLTIPDNVKVLFDLTYKEVADWYSRATAVVISMKEMHRSSGQMTLTDTIQAGKPIIASDVVGISHYGLKSGRDALLVSPGNSDLLKGAIARIVDDNNLRRRLEAQTKKLAKIFTTENYAQNISESVEWAIDPIKLRPLRQEDLEFARRLRNENRQHFFDDGYISRQSQVKWFEAYQKKNDDFMFILEDGGSRVGMGAIYNIDRPKSSAEIGRFVIDKQFQGKSYGKTLIAKIERVAFVELGMEKVFLEVMVENETALELYEKAGFERDKTRIVRGKRVIQMVKYASEKS